MLNRAHSFIVTREFFVAVIILMIIQSIGLCGSRVKVHKNLIQIQTSAQKGFVEATGSPGAIEFSSPVIASIENMSTRAKTGLVVNEDGSFKATVKAEPVHKIKVWARNKEGKRSYGTFSIMTSSISEMPKPTNTVPLATPTAGKKDTPENKPVTSLDAISVTTTPAQKTIVSPPAFTQFAADAPAPENMKLAVIITVVNLETGQIVAAKRVAGTTRVKPDQNVLFKNIVSKIISRCTNIAKSEITKPLFSGIRNSTKTSPDMPRPTKTPEAAKPASPI